MCEPRSVSGHGRLGQRLRAFLGPVVLVALGAGSGAAGPPPSASPIAVLELVRALADGAPLRGWVARVDLTDTRVSFVVPGRQEPRASERGPAEALLVPVDEWARRAGATLAINANYFARLPGALPLPWTEGQAVDILGLSVSAGVAVSRQRETGGGDPVLLIDEKRGHGDDARCPCSVRVRLARRVDLQGIDEGVAGLGGSEGGGRSTLLVEAGRNRGATARVQPLNRHPRTAAGVTRDGRTLVLLVVDGRQPGWSAGATLVELADLMRDQGVWTGLNLDGGGSSTFWWRAPQEAHGRVQNRPSDGRARPVANALGVRIAPAAPGSP
jgi:hypothetical protein